MSKFNEFQGPIQLIENDELHSLRDSHSKMHSSLVHFAVINER